MLESFDIADLALVWAIFLAGGLVKGVTGFGLPTVTLGLLALTRPLPEAMALVLVPTIATNIWQAFASGALREVLRRLWGFVLAGAVCTLAASGLLSRADATRLAGLLGILLVLSSVLALLGPRWPVPPPGRERWLSPLMGGLSGILAGLTGSFMMPAAPWLAALRLPADHFVQAFGLGAVTVTFVLAASMFGQGLLPANAGIASLVGLVPAFLAMAVGRQLRQRLPEAGFRRLVQVALLVLGLYLATRAFL